MIKYMKKYFGSAGHDHDHPQGTTTGYKRIYGIPEKKQT